MKFVGIDVGSKKHFLAAVDSEGTVVQKARPFAESAEGYALLMELVGEDSS
jgi:hypothetical protein